MTQQNIPAVPAHWPSESALITELKATFPGIHARPLAEFGYKPCRHGVWTGGEAALADGELIFSSLCCNDPDYYDGQVHHAFIAWLDQRGWVVENYDGHVFFIRSKAEHDDESARSKRLDDLLEQRTEAMIVLHRIEAAIAIERSAIGDMDDFAEAYWAAAERQKAEEHLAALAELREKRRGYLRPSARLLTDDDLPF
jgi:hypothetical protein